MSERTYKVKVVYKIKPTKKYDKYILLLSIQVYVWVKNITWNTFTLN